MAEVNEIENSRKLATKIADLPQLPPDSMRAVHFTYVERVDEIIATGLSYEKYGMAMSTARAWSDPDKVEFTSTDPRYRGEGVRAIVMDMSSDEWKLHNRTMVAPGRISQERIVGVINPNEVKAL